MHPPTPFLEHMATYTVGRIITFPNLDGWKEVGFVAENT